MSDTRHLRSLRDQPFELLVEMDRRARSAQTGQQSEGGLESEWVGVAFGLCGQPLLAPRDEVREVMTCPPTTRIPGAKHWIRGLANIRGQLLPVIDLKAFLGGTPIPRGRGVRVLAVNHKTVPAGLLVDEVMGFRRFLQTERQEAGGGPLEGLEDFVTDAFSRGAQSWPVVSLSKLVESERFLNAAL